MKKLLLCMVMMFCMCITANAEPNHESIVLIRTQAYQERDSRGVAEWRTGGTGTGFFIGNNKILTCYHVLSRHIEKGAAVRIEYRNHQYYDVKVLKIDKANDLALISVSVPNEQIATFGNTEPNIGDVISHYGHPKGMWTVHFNAGKVTKIYGLENPPKSGHKIRTYFVPTLVHRGMSGGPIFNKDDKVVGMIYKKPSKRAGDFHERKGAMSISLPVIKAFLKGYSLDIRVK